MKQKSLSNNVLLNLIKVLMSLVFPLITFPYASRVLGPTGIGQVNFAQSIVSYFQIIAALGISGYAIRGVAKLRDKKLELQSFVKEVLTINFISTIVAYFFLALGLALIGTIRDHAIVIIVCSSSILFSTIGMEWLYTGLEEFKYITIRSIAFQGISLVLLFLLVRDESDVVNYAIVCIVANVGSNVCNFIHSRKIIDLFNAKIINLKKHFKPILVLFALAITSSIYTLLDTSMLGFMRTDYEVGIYSAATKINRIIVSLVTSIGTVLLPRLSYYVGTKDKEKFNDLAYTSVDVILMFAFPCCIGLNVLASESIQIICGPEYASAVTAMRIMNPLIVFVGMSNFTGVQLFLPLKKEKWVLYSDLVGAAVNFTINILLIPQLGVVGCAIGSIVAEGLVALIQLYLARKIIELKVIVKKLLYYFSISIAMGVSISLVGNGIENVLIKTSLKVIIGVAIYFVMLLITKNKSVHMILNKYLKKK